MRPIIGWFGANPVAANLLMFMLIISGLATLSGVQQKTFPDIDVNVIQIGVTYLGAAPGAVARSKRLTRMLGPEITQLKIEATIEALADAWDDAEAHEGVAAFFEKRKPSWKT